MSRGIAFNRDIRNRKIAHRKMISEHYNGFPYYEYDGQYSKGKIHCSCVMCTFSKKFHLKSFKDVLEDEIEKYELESEE